MPRPPNIVLGMADDVTPAFHGCYGGRTPTPHLDRLAREGVLFARCCGVAALCNPSRYSIFTGRYPGRAASVTAGCSDLEPYSVKQNADLEPGDPTLATVLRAAGYRTGHVGKWHSNFAIVERVHDRWKPAGVREDSNLDDPDVDAALRDAHDCHREVVQRSTGFEWVAATSWGNLDDKKPLPLRHHNVPWLTDRALEFLQLAATDPRPFYLHLANSVPHSPDPLAGLGRDRRYTLGGKLAQTPRGHPPDETVLARMRSAGIDPEEPAAGVSAGMIQLDDQVGALLAQLDALGLADDTIFVYTADHGILGKGTCYHAGFHVPLLLRWPRAVRASRRIEHLVSLVDLFPTLCAAAGVEESALPAVDGASFLPALRDPAAPPARTVAYQEMGVARSVVRDRWHYIAFRYPASVARQVAEAAIDLPPDLFAYTARAPSANSISPPGRTTSSRSNSSISRRTRASRIISSTGQSMPRCGKNCGPPCTGSPARCPGRSPCPRRPKWVPPPTAPWSSVAAPV